MNLLAQINIRHVIEEVQDSSVWTILTSWPEGHGLHVPLWSLGPFTLTKFMLLELVAAGLMLAIFVPLARRAARQLTPTGPWWNAFEGMLTFLRDEVARPCLQPAEVGHGAHEESTPGSGEHGPATAAPHAAAAADPTAQADRFVPFLWTVFFFILFCNLLGLLPAGGSPTADLRVTGALALCTFVTVHGAGIYHMGFWGYVKSLWPTVHLPLVIAIFLKPMIFGIELLGTVIKCCVLAVRLFANMFAGHTVLGTILYFIVLTARSSVLLWAGVTVASVLGVVALSLLELFVAFLQAYIFTFLTALFIGMALHPPH
jgi:F-type H+-transporting ATPase subunit a